MWRRTGQAISPFIPDFFAAHPGISLDLRVVPNPKVASTALVDVLVFVGWLEDVDMVTRRIAQTRYVTCASLEQGLLQPVLEDWEALEAPPVRVMYRRGSRPSARVRAFVNFVTELFPSFEASRVGPIERKVASVPTPWWLRQSLAVSLTRRARRRADSGT